MACPSSAPPITEGSLIDFSHDLLGGLLRLHREHGPIAMFRDPHAGQSVVAVFDPEHNRTVLSDVERFQARFFAIRGPRRSSQRRVTCGLLAMNGPQHKRNRRLVKEPFGPKAIAGYRETISELAEEESARWTAGEPFDFNEAMIRYMLRVTSRLLFGLDEPALAYELGEQVAEWVELNNRLGVGALVSNDEFSAGYEGLLEFAERLEANVLRLIRSRRERPDSEAKDVLSLLVGAADEAGGLSDEELVGQACVLFAAAHMTTAHAFSWTSFLLAQHPAAMRSVVNAVREGSVDRAPSPRVPSLLIRVINESMRVLPPSAYSVRVAAEPLRLGPLDLARGTPIVFTPLVTHRLPHVFPEPERFDPDRWLSIHPTAYEYHPFGAGPRRCIGGPLAIEVLRTSLPVFLRDWRLRTPEGARVDVEVKSTMLNPLRGVPMIAERHPGDPATEPWPAAAPVTGNVRELVDLPSA
ncbi:MAG: cytochrome P450 [Planctomycetota bacterium]